MPRESKLSLPKYSKLVFLQRCARPVSLVLGQRWEGERKAQDGRAEDGGQEVGREEGNSVRPSHFSQFITITAKDQFTLSLAKRSTGRLGVRTPRFTARRYASAVLAVIVCLSVCPSVCHKSELYKDG